MSTPRVTSHSLRILARALLQLRVAMRWHGEVLHIGSNFEIAVDSLFGLIAELMNSDAQIELDPVRQRPAKSEVERLWCNNEKLRSATGFAPETTLRDGLKETITWFRDPVNLRRYKTHLYNV